MLELEAFRLLENWVWQHVEVMLNLEVLLPTQLLENGVAALTGCWETKVN